MKFQAIAFDLDGTLTDSMPFHASAWVASFAAVAAIDIVPSEAYIREGAKDDAFVREVFDKYAGVELQPSVVEQLVGRYKDELKKIYHVRFFPGAEEAVDTLIERGFRLALVSGSQNVPALLGSKSAFLSRFEIVVSGKDTPVGKPHPAPFLKAFAGLGVSPGQCLVVENAPLGIRSAAAAGAVCWAVLNNSPLTEGELISAGAAKAFPDLAALCLESDLAHR